MFKPCNGQSLAEYGLGIALVGIVCIGALTVVGIQLGNILPNAGVHMAGGQFSQKSQNTNALLNNLNLAEVSGLKTLKLKLSDGTTVELNNVPTNMTSSIETLGSNGTTTLLASQIQSLVEQLETAGELDIEQASILKDLANQGYRIADIQKMIEDHAKLSASETVDLAATENIYITDYVQYFRVQNLDYDNISCNAHCWADRVGWSYNSEERYWSFPENTSLFQTDQYSPGPEIENFISLYRQAEENGSLNNPVVKELISAFSSDLLKTAHNFQNSTIEVHFNNYWPSEVMAKAEQASQRTSYDSAGICTTGDYSVGEQQCL